MISKSFSEILTLIIFHSLVIEGSIYPG